MKGFLKFVGEVKCNCVEPRSCAIIGQGIQSVGVLVLRADFCAVLELPLAKV